MSNQIHIMGPVGVGKSSLSHLLSVREGITLFPEPVEDNPYLALFYEDPEKYAFQLQIFMLHRRFIQTQEAQNLDVSIMDMSMIGNDLFAELMFMSGSMSKTDYELYSNVSTSLKSLVEPPELMVYLQCSIPEAIRRIMRRGRPSELKAPLQYWYDLNHSYEKWYNAYSFSKKICINVDNLDFVNDEEDEDYVLDMIMEELQK